MSRIHLLKTMTLELSEIQTLQAVSNSASVAHAPEHSRNVDGRVESGLRGLRLDGIGVDGGQRRVVASAVLGGSRLLVGHLCGVCGAGG